MYHSMRKPKKLTDIKDREKVDDLIIHHNNKIDILLEHRRKLSLIGFKTPRDNR